MLLLKCKSVPPSGSVSHVMFGRGPVRGSLTRPRFEPLEDRFVPASLTFEAEAAQVRTVGGQIGAFWILNQNGYVGEYLSVASPGIYTFTARAGGSAAAGSGPQLSLVVDGATTQTWQVAAGSIANYAASVNLAAGVHEIRFGFINDLQTASEDRNLYVDWFKVDTGALPAPARATSADWATAVKAQENAILAQANSLIEQNRKGDMTLKVVDLNGAPVAGASVTIEQLAHDFQFGANLFMYARFGSAEENQLYLDRFSSLFNDATVPFYWNSIETAPGQRDFTYTDQLVNWATQNGISLKGHPLIWNTADALPSWIGAGGPTAAQVQAQINAVMQRYAGKVTRWDVVNELVNLPGVDVAAAYQWARQADPNATLVVNEYGEFVDGAPRVQAFLKSAAANGIPWDAVGLQGHSPVTERFGMGQVWQTINAFGSLGKPVYLSELTPPSAGQTMTGGVWTGTWDEAAQADYAVKLFTTAFANPNVAGVSWWDLSDSGAFAPGGGLLDSDLNPKAAYTALDNLINGAWHTSVSARTASDGTISFRGFYGQYQVSVSLGAAAYTGDYSLVKGEGNTWQVRLNAVVGRPTAAISGPDTIVRAEPNAFQLTASGGAGSTYAYAIDWDGNGVVDQTVVGGAKTQVIYSFPKTGTYNVRVTATDGSGVVSPVATAAFTVKPWVLRSGAGDPSIVTLVYGGTIGGDEYTFVDQGTTVVLVKTIQNDQPVSITETFTGVTGGIMVYAQGGDDVMLGGLLATQRLTVYGGAGNDILVGGRMADILVGGPDNDVLMGQDGDDRLEGAAGHDVVIGGAGANYLTGGLGNDLILAASTVYDRDRGFWTFMRSYWSDAQAPLDTKIAELSGATTKAMPYLFIPGQTLTADSQVDQILSNDGADWLLYDFARDLALDFASATDRRANV